MKGNDARRRWAMVARAVLVALAAEKTGMRMTTINGTGFHMTVQPLCL